MAQSVLDILAAAGIKGDEALAMLRTAKREESEKRAAMLEERKGSNREAVIDGMIRFREELAEFAADLLPGSHLNLTVRVDKEGNVVATANDCHATGFVEALHVTPEGEVVKGAEGAEKAKNVRPRKKG